MYFPAICGKCSVTQSSVRLFVTLLNVAHQDPLARGLDSPGKNIGVKKKAAVACLALLQGIFLIQGLNSHPLHLLPFRGILYPLSYPGSRSYGMFLA